MLGSRVLEKCPQRAHTQALTTWSLKLVVLTTEKFISRYMDIAASIMSEPSPEGWTSKVPAVLEQCKTLAAAFHVLDSHLAWPQDKEGAAECAPVKSALSCLGSALGCMDTFRQVVHGRAKELPGSALHSFIALDAFTASKPYINRKESIGEAELVKNYLAMREFYAAMLPKVVDALESHTAGPIEEVKQMWGKALPALRVIERSLVSAESKPTPEVLQDNLRTLSDLCVKEHLAKLETLSSSKLQTQRVHVLLRVFSAANLIGAQWGDFLSSIGKMSTKEKILAELEQHEKLIQIWITGNQNAFATINAEWFASTDELERVATLVGDLSKAGKDFCFLKVLPPPVPLHVPPPFSQTPTAYSLPIPIRTLLVPRIPPNPPLLW